MRRGLMASAIHALKVCLHALGIGGAIAEQFECLYCLEHGHGAAIQSSATQGASVSKQLGLKREIDNLGHPKFCAKKRYS